MNSDSINPVMLVGIALIIIGILAIASGHLAGGLIVIGVGLLTLGVAGEGSAEGAGLVVSGSPGLVTIGIGVIVYFLMGQRL